MVDSSILHTDVAKIMIYPLLLYDFANYKPREVGMIARALTLIINEYYRQMQRQRPGWEPFAGMVCSVFSKKELILDRVSLESKAGMGIKDANWSIIPTGISNTGFGKLQFSSQTARIAHEIAHSILWRYYNSGKMGVSLVHYFYNGNLPVVRLHDSVFGADVLACNLEYLVKNKDKIIAEIKSGKAPPGILPYSLG